MYTHTQCKQRTDYKVDVSGTLGAMMLTGLAVSLSGFVLMFLLIPLPTATSFHTV